MKTLTSHLFYSHLLSPNIQSLVFLLLLYHTVCISIMWLAIFNLNTAFQCWFPFLSLFVHTASAYERTCIYCVMPQRPENNAAYSRSRTLAVTAIMISFLCVTTPWRRCRPLWYVSSLLHFPNHLECLDSTVFFSVVEHLDGGKRLETTISSNVLDDDWSCNPLYHWQHQKPAGRVWRSGITSLKVKGGLNPAKPSKCQTIPLANMPLWLLLMESHNKWIH